MTSVMLNLKGQDGLPPTNKKKNKATSTLHYLITGNQTDISVCPLLPHA